jgi:hypothetical protein
LATECLGALRHEKARIHENRIVARQVSTSRAMRTKKWGPNGARTLGG